MILVDYSQVALSAILTFQRELKGTESEVKNLIRHVTLSTLKSYKKKYGRECGELVIACDGRKYWRKDIFEHYKASRKKMRDASDLDWKLIPVWRARARPTRTGRQHAHPRRQLYSA